MIANPPTIESSLRGRDISPQRGEYANSSPYSSQVFDLKGMPSPQGHGGSGGPRAAPNHRCCLQPGEAPHLEPPPPPYPRRGSLSASCTWLTLSSRSRTQVADGLQYLDLCSATAQLFA